MWVEWQLEGFIGQQVKQEDKTGEVKFQKGVREKKKGKKNIEKRKNQGDKSSALTCTGMVVTVVAFCFTRSLSRVHLAPIPV